MSRARISPVRLLLSAAAVLGALMLGASPVATAHVDRRPLGAVVVANRGGQSISVIDVASDVTETIPLPGAARPAEPMYVVDAGRGRLLVGDRGNNRVIVLDRRSFEVRGEVPTGAGVFHMWAGGGRLWVNNDVDKTGTVVALDDLSVERTVPMPRDLVDLGGRPHDVVLDRFHGRYAYVSMIGVPGAVDYVVKFDVDTGREVGRAAVGKDPHVSYDERHEQLFVPAQGSGLLHVLDGASLASLDVLRVPGAHGAGMSTDGRRFYTTNLPGGGIGALTAIDTWTRRPLADAIDAPFAAPHNVALATKARKLYVTHSGATATAVSVYTLDGAGRPTLAGALTAGLNPFGIAFLP